MSRSATSLLLPIWMILDFMPILSDSNWVSLVSAIKADTVLHVKDSFHLDELLGSTLL